jgi:hypothetical protein
MTICLGVTLDLLLIVNCVTGNLVVEQLAHFTLLFFIMFLSKGVKLEKVFDLTVVANVAVTEVSPLTSTVY